MRISDWSSDVCSSDLWAEKHGFGVSRRQVDAEIASIPAFQIGGRFDQASYEAALAQQNLSDRELRKGMTGDLLRSQEHVRASVRVREGKYSYISLVAGS